MQEVVWPLLKLIVYIFHHFRAHPLLFDPLLHFHNSLSILLQIFPDPLLLYCLISKDRSINRWLFSCLLVRSINLFPFNLGPTSSSSDASHLPQTFLHRLYVLLQLHLLFVQFLLLNVLYGLLVLFFWLLILPLTNCWSIKKNGWCVDIWLLYVQFATCCDISTWGTIYCCLLSWRKCNIRCCKCRSLIGCWR